MKDFLYYLQCFTNLHTARLYGKQAPHKPLLLLSVLDLVEQGRIADNHIVLNDPLINAFTHNVMQYIGSDNPFTPGIGQPFYHMQYEPFWRLVPSMAGELEVNKNPHYSINKLRLLYRYAEIDAELFELLQDSNIRFKLKEAIIQEYFA